MSPSPDDDTQVLPPVRPTPTPHPVILPVRAVRDWITVVLGTGMLVSQAVVAWMGKTVSVPIVTAGLTLLAVWPTFKIGDRKEDDQR